MAIFKLLLSMAVGYLLGSMLTAVFVGNYNGINLRKKGSGNPGLTNTYRVLGAKAACIVLVGDIAKGIIACVLGYILTANEFGSERFFDLESPNIGMMLAGTSCVFGHIFPLFFQFKGGKAVLTSAVVILLMDYRIGLIALCVFVVIVLISRYVSVGSLIAAASLPASSAILGKPGYFMVYTVALALLIIIMHRQNIGRLINGTEPRQKLMRDDTRPRPRR